MTPIEILFEKLAFTTWDAIQNAFGNRISFGEDAITSINLLALKNASFPTIAIEDTRPSESTKGCDFEFWIGTHKSGWYRYAIQAKKIRVSDERYASLGHKTGNTFQIDILERYSLANKAIPLYCLFNFSKRKPTSSTSCLKYQNIKELGCSVTPSSTIKLALSTRGARGFKWLHGRPETLPWSCLVRCPQLYNHWPEKMIGIQYKEIIHKELPEPLARLLEQSEEPVNFFDSDIFSKETPYRPGWIGVINNIRAIMLM